MKRKYPTGLVIMGMIINMIKGWPIPALAMVLLAARLFLSNIPLWLVLGILLVWVGWALLNSLKVRYEMLKMRPGDEMLDKMFADNDKGYRNIIDTIEEIIKKEMGDDE